jgi:hypothetical protein
MFPRTIVTAMADATDAAINDVLLNGAGQMLVRPKKEIAYVAAMTIGGIHEIANAWGPICSGQGITMRLAGVFCHAAPVVTFNGKSGKTDCELADLLVVTDLKRRSQLTRRAALIQAKMARAKQRLSLTGPSSCRQLDLYQNWHRFDFVDSAYGMTGVDFQVGPGSVWSGTFGAIDPRFDGQPRWTQHLPSPTPQIIYRTSPQLGRFMAEMADGTQPGFGRLATPSLKTDWSKTVELLLTVTYARAFGDKAVLGPARPPRGTSAVVCLGSTALAVEREAYQGLLPGTAPPFGAAMFGEAEREPNGLSLVHFEFQTDRD